MQLENDISKNDPTVSSISFSRKIPTLRFYSITKQEKFQACRNTKSSATPLLTCAKDNRNDSQMSRQKLLRKAEVKRAASKADTFQG